MGSTFFPIHSSQTLENVADKTGVFAEGNKSCAFKLSLRSLASFREMAGYAPMEVQLRLPSFVWRNSHIFLPVGNTSIYISRHNPLFAGEICPV
jgi:hypothetical protein